MPGPAKVDKTPELPKFGAWLPAEQFHVSKCNVRIDEPFGESEKDKLLIEALRRGNIVEPMLARPEDKGWGVYAGRRRLLAENIIGTKRYLVGKDVLIAIVSDEQARKASLIENLDVYRDELNPLARARAIQNMLNSDQRGLRAVARDFGLAPSTLSEWTQPLQLTPPMQKALEKGQIFYKDARDVARLKLGEIKEKELADAAETGGREAFVAELDKIQTGHEKRGIPAGKYLILRTPLEIVRNKQIIENIEQLAKAKNMDLAEYSYLVWTDKKTSMEYAKSLP